MGNNTLADTLRVVGQDDGHDTIKTCTGWDPAAKKFQYGYHKSRAVQGLEQVMSLGRHGTVGGAYETEGQRFTIADGQSLLRPLDTRIGNYALSPLNRILVNHSLAACGLADTPIYLVTGLPVDIYYRDGAPNEEVIENKMRNLATSVQRIGAGPGLAQIVKQGVLSEATAAFYDALIQPDGSFDAEIEKLISRRPFGVVDMGGKTTDIVVISEEARSVYKERSGTDEIGVLGLLDKVGERLKAEFKLNSNPPTPHVEEACRTKRFELFGEEKDVSHIVEAECREHLSKVQNFFVSKVRDGSDLGAVLFVGGGTALIRSVLGMEAFASVYQGRRLIADEPEYANARGMWKYGMFVVSPTERSLPKEQTTKASRSSTVVLNP